MAEPINNDPIVSAESLDTAQLNPPETQPSQSLWNNFYPKTEDEKIPDQLQHLGNIALSRVYQTFEGRYLDPKALGKIPTEQAQKVLIDKIQDTSDDEEAIRITKDFYWYLGVSGVRKILRSKSDDPRIMDILKKTFTSLALDPVPEEEIAIDLGRDVYGKADMSRYGPYLETLPFEIDLLSKACVDKDAKTILDVGCGSGRHLLAVSERLQTEGRIPQLFGVDILESDIAQLRQDHSNIDARTGSWFDLPFEDLSMDLIYMLGRSFTHNTTAGDAIRCLREMGRKLKDDGEIILDLPNPNVGEYKELIEKSKATLREKGVWSSMYIPGLIVDSPDGVHFFDRLALDSSQFYALCNIAGFSARKISSTKYNSLVGTENENTYWVLTKHNPPYKPNFGDYQGDVMTLYQKYD